MRNGNPESSISHDRLTFIPFESTEIGVNTFSPILTVHSVVREDSIIKRISRWERIITSSCKQCLQPWFPSVNNPTVLTKLKEKSAANDIWLLGDSHGESIHKVMKKFISDVQAKTKPPSSEEPTVEELEGRGPPSPNVNIVVGPEGGFTDHEMEELKRLNNSVIVSVNNHRLRTETATITFASIVASFLKELQES